jgi:hypothetical protein
MAVRLDAETADRFREVHEQNTLDPLSKDTLIAVIERDMEVEQVVSLDMTDVHPAPNSARPQQILVCDCRIEWTSGETENTGLEIQCSETVDSQNSTQHEDGTISLPVSEMTAKFDYQTLNLSFF